MEASKLERLSTRKITPIVTYQLNGTVENENENKEKSWTSVSNIAVIFLNMLTIMYQLDMPKV